MTHPPFPFRILAALVVLAVVALVCAALGQWQLRRAAEREFIHASIMAGRQATPLSITPATPAPDLQNWRAAQATGQWLNRYTVLLANRNLDGRPGYWVATPLALAAPFGPRADAPHALQSPGPDNTAHTGTAILVLRGWIPRPLGANASLPPLASAQDTQTIRGELREHVPRLFELGSISGTESGLPANPATTKLPLEVQNIDLENFTAVTGIKLLPAVLQQTSAASLEDGTPLIQNWPTPSLDADKNRGYALQWFAFAAIAAGAWLVLAWRTLRQRPARSANALRKE